MTKRVFRSIFIVAGSVLLASFIIILGVLYEHFTAVQKKQLTVQTQLARHAVELEGETYLQGLDLGDEYRITWTDSKGNVLYDSKADADAMENHAERQEIKEALKNGSGSSIRYSQTRMERTIYYAERLEDGTVLRLSVTLNTVISLLIGMAQPIAVILLFALILSGVLASQLAKRIVKPLNELNLDQPLDNEVYEEISPLLMRIERQHREIRQQLEILKEKREEWNTVTECMNEGIILLNDKDVIISMNRSAMRLLETDDTAVGKEILSVNRNLLLQGVIEKAKQREHAETVLELDEGDYQVAASSITSNHTLRGVVLLMFDITNKEIAEQIRREFTANVSHELKTPLHSISGCAEILKDGLVEPEDVPRFINQIFNESKRMVTLVDDIIRLSKLDEGVEEAPREEINLYQMAKEIGVQLTPVAEQKQVQIKVNGNDAYIRGILPQMKELIYNLCDNAIKYNREGGTVDITVAAAEERVTLSVKDSGIGIPREHLSRIFERFYRVDKSHSKEIGGTGLGLSIVKHIAKVHDATLDVRSTVGEGSVFTIVFPVK